MATRSAARRLAPWAAYALLLALAPWVFPSPLALNMLSQIGIGIVACLSFNLLFGQGGMLSFGHAVYTGLGGYAAIHAMNAAAQGALPVPLVAVPLLGGLAGLGVAWLLGGLATRRAGTSFAMITLGLGELVVALTPLLPGVFGGEGGIAGNRVYGRPWLGLDFGAAIEVYGLIAVHAYACTAALYAFTRTPLGRLLNAVRDNDERVAFLGTDPRRVRHRAFAIAGFFAGVSGALAAILFEIVTPEVLGAARSGTVLLFTVLGGSAVFAGPVVGAVLMVLATVALSGLTPAWLLYVGLAFVGVVMVAPGGLVGLASAGAGRLRRDGLRALAPLGLAGLAGAAMAFAGVAGMVEMAYHLRLDDARGAPPAVFGLALDTASAATWAGAALLAGAGLALAAWAGARLRGREGAA